MNMNRRSFLLGGTAATASVVASRATASACACCGASKPALLGGTPVIPKAEQAAELDMFQWPRVNAAMRRASDAVLVGCKMSANDVSLEFEEKFAMWQGTKYALSFPNGTTSLNAAMYAVGLGAGDEMICTSLTYWASCLGALNLRARVVFCDVREDLEMDPASVEAAITPRTKAIMCVHYKSHPCDMDPIMAIARKHGLKVIEDCSHAQGGLYKGRKLGTIGDIAGMSCMTFKSFSIGEGGMMVTNDYELYRRAIRFGHYERIAKHWKPEELEGTRNVPLGAMKNRLNQCAAAVGIEQLKKYDAECAEITQCKEYFYKGIADVKGLSKVYPVWENSNKAGWYSSVTHYDPAAFCGISADTFVDALKAETGECCDYQFGHACDFPLHTSSVFSTFDTYHSGRPVNFETMPAGLERERAKAEFPVASTIRERIFCEPWFKLFIPTQIDRYVEAVHKVAAAAPQLADWEKAHPRKA